MTLDQTLETALDTTAPTPDVLSAMLTRALRSPLATSEGYLELLAAGAIGPLTEEQREYLDVVSRNIQRMSVVVGDWIDVCRIEAGHLEMARKPVDLEGVVREVVASLGARISDKSQQLTVETPGVPSVVLGDARALARVLDNLLSNAHKFTAPGGAIHVLLKSGPDETVSLSVADTGIGLCDEDQKQVYRKFFRGQMTEAEPGIGLGLTLARALTEHMGGRIMVTSALGKGSTFTVRLPRASGATNEPSAAIPAAFG